MKPVAFIFDPIFLEHDTGKGHPESAQRLRVILGDVEPIKEELLWLTPQAAPLSTIALVHPREYISLIEQSCAREAAMDPDTPTSQGSYEAALTAVGAGILAVDTVHAHKASSVFCAVRPPGHHALAHRAMGFCLFNNIAITARYAQSQGYKKVMIVDFDVHHGNGTQGIFYEDPSVFYFSTHQYPAYPGSGAREEKGSGAGAGFTRNFPLDMFSTDEDILPIYEEELPDAVAEFQPDIILVSAGYDLHEDDPLAQLQITTRGIGEIVRAIMECSKVPKIFMLEGGYNLDALGESVALTLKTMQEY